MQNKNIVVLRCSISMTMLFAQIYRTFKTTALRFQKNHVPQNWVTKPARINIARANKIVDKGTSINEEKTIKTK